MQTRLTTEMLTPFIGGQAEIQNQNEGYIYRGEIAMAEVVGTNLNLKFNWLAKGEGYPPIPHRWVGDKGLDYAISLDISSVSNIGPSNEEIGGGDRLAINCPILGELTVLYPADGSKLDPTKVEGLVPASAPTT